MRPMQSVVSAMSITRGKLLLIERSVLFHSSLKGWRSLDEHRDDLGLCNHGCVVPPIAGRNELRGGDSAERRHATEKKTTEKFYDFKVLYQEAISKIDQFLC